MDIGSSYLSSGSYVTGAIETPPVFLQQATLTAKPALENIQMRLGPFVTTQEVNTTHPNPPPISTSPLLPPPHPPLPPTDGFPPPLDIVPGSVSLIRRPSRPVVCKKHFELRAEDASFHSRMLHARVHKNLREPKILKKTFCSPNEKGTCQAHRSSRCLTIDVGPSRHRCKTETVALRDIRKVLGLCWTCNTW
jgi:hypothetical protein